MRDKETEATNFRNDLLRRNGTRPQQPQQPQPPNSKLEAQRLKLLLTPQTQQPEAQAELAQAESAQRRLECQDHLRTITDLTTALSKQTYDGQLLRDELDARLETLIAYEVDLETHDIHYTDYLEEQRKLEEEALEEIFDDDDDVDNKDVDTDVATDDDTTKRRLTALKERHGGCRVEELISKLLTDYSDLEARYKRDRTEDQKTIDRLREENETLNSTVKVLTEKSFAFGNNNHNNHKIYLKRISQLERANERLQHSRATLKERIEVLQEEKCQQQLGSVENSTSSDTTSGLPDPLDYHNNETYDASSNVHELRRRLKDHAKTIAKLQIEQSHKEKKIAALKWQAVNHQLRKDLCPDDVNNNDKAKSTAPTEEARQDEIDLLKDTLLQKDREIVKERKRFAQREASLLARFKDVVPDPQRVGSNPHRKLFLK